MPPIPQTIGKGVVTVSRLSFLGVLKFLVKHWYLVSIFIFIIPTIITSVKIGLEENSEYQLPEQVARTSVHSLAKLGITLLNADSQIDEDVKALRRDPTELLGEKPEKGIINKGKYYWNVWLVIWKILGNIFLISIPFALAYRYFKIKGEKGVQSSPGKNIGSALLLGVAFMFIMNLIFTIIGLATGSLIMSFPEGINLFTQVWLVVLNTIPFHGVLNLILYLGGVSW